MTLVDTPNLAKFSKAVDNIKEHVKTGERVLPASLLLQLTLQTCAPGQEGWGGWWIGGRGEGWARWQRSLFQGSSLCLLGCASLWCAHAAALLACQAARSCCLVSPFLRLSPRLAVSSRAQ